jgi:putative hemin transport protein
VPIDARPADPAEIRRLRSLHPEMRERDFARIHRISEAELIAAFVGHGATRLNPDVETLLAGAGTLGEVMVLTRNQSAVHEKIGPFDKTHYGPQASMALGDHVDLRIFPQHWASGFSVEKTGTDGAVRRSLQFFDRAGDAVFKIHLRESSNLEAYRALVARLTATEQADTVAVVPYEESEALRPDAASPAALKAEWDQLTDTHQFVPMLRRLNLTRHQAVSMIDSQYAWPLGLDAVTSAFQQAAESALPIMVFIGNRGCIQIHAGPISRVETMGPWLNVMDETFHMHLRLDEITELWAVRKPTKDGHVTSIEAFGADRKLIVQLFGERQEGVDERSGWRALVENLPHLSRSTAA